jgi:2-polyprenyl-3-methyl-5-hydroxy-6-metoxy-1,4-benzoquinol methylase
MYKYGAWHKISKVNYGILFSMNDEQRVYFTRAYTTGTDLWSQLPVASLRNEFIAGLPQNALVLDVGAGRGLWARTLVESGVRVIGIDYVETIVAHVNNELKDRGWESRARFVRNRATYRISIWLKIATRSAMGGWDEKSFWKNCPAA